MAYVPNYGGNWQTGAGGATPITEAALDNLETQYQEVLNTWDANTILAANADNTPLALTIAASRILGRKAAGNIGALTGAEIMAILTGQNGADFSMNTHKITGVTDPGANQDAATKKYHDDNLPTVTKQFYIPCYYGNDALSNQGYALTAAGKIANLFFRVPDDFAALTSVNMLLVAVGTGDFDWTVDTAWGANGENRTTHTDSATANAQAGTNQVYLELDISAAFTGLAAGDIVVITFTLDAVNTMTGLVVVGADFKY